MGKKDPTKPGVVYVVTDRQEPERVRYVGRTVQGISARAGKHWLDSKKNKTAFSNWLRSRAHRREDVVFTEISWHPDVPALNKAEVAAIAHYRSIGQADLNLTSGGDGGSPGPWDETRRQNHFKRVPRGDNHPLSVMTWKQVKAIRDKAIKEPVNSAHLAQEYGVSVATMSEILRNETWYDPGYDPETRKFFSRHGDMARNRKITGEQVKEIRERRMKKYTSNTEMAKEYGITGDMVYRIVKNMNWYDPEFNPDEVIPRGRAG